MERQIIFRGKTIETNVWVYGDYSHDAVFHPSGGFADTIWDNGGLRTVERNTVGMFTNLCDKNDKPIYEGDIVKRVQINAEHNGDDDSISIGSIGHIVYDNYTAAFKLECKVDFYGEQKFSSVQYRQPLINKREEDKKVVFEYEVIGNIYDNPELLNNE